MANDPRQQDRPPDGPGAPEAPAAAESAEATDALAGTDADTAHATAADASTAASAVPAVTATPAVDGPRPADGHSSFHLPPRRHASPWSNRALVLASAVIVLLLAPLWLDPMAVGQLGARPAGSPGAAATPAGPADLRPAPTAGAAGQARTLVQDSFSRQVTAGWGAADLGGVYQVEGSAGILAVDAGAGTVTVTAGPGGDVLLPDDARDVELVFSLSTATLPGQGELRVHALLRATAGRRYQTTFHLGADGSVTVTAEVLGAGAARQIGGPIAVPGASTEAGSPLLVRVSANGGDPTTLGARIWPATETEPRYWDLSVVDWTGSMQGAGALGLGWELAGAPPGTPVTLLVDDLAATTTDRPVNR